METNYSLHPRKRQIEDSPGGCDPKNFKQEDVIKTKVEIDENRNRKDEIVDTFDIKMAFEDLMGKKLHLRSDSMIERVLHDQYDGISLLHVAVELNDLAAVKKLLALGANVNARHEDTRYTPLHMCNSVEVAKLLVEAGADVNARSGSFTSLVLALDQSNNELFEFLLANGANLNYLKEFLGFDADADVTIGELTYRYFWESD